jgi:hypothetical protein
MTQTKNNFLSTQTKFLSEYVFPFLDNPSTLYFVAKMYTTKSLKKLIKILSNNTKYEQVVGISLRIKFDDGSFRSLSPYKKLRFIDLPKIGSLFKQLLISRSEHYRRMKLKVVSIVYTYHVYPSDYVLTDIEKTILEPEVIKPTSKESLQHLTDDKTNIKYMNLFKIFKLPLSFTGSIQFLLELKLLNNNISDQIVLDDDNIKYRILFNTISTKEMEVNLVLQEDPSMILYKVKDKLF